MSGISYSCVCVLYSSELSLHLVEMNHLILNLGPSTTFVRRHICPNFQSSPYFNAVLHVCRKLKFLFGYLNRVQRTFLRCVL